MAELLLDSQIRFWVFLPIVIITFLIGAVKHYFSILLASENKLDIQQLQDNHALKRAHLLRENAKYIPCQSFQMRCHFFNSERDGYLKTRNISASSQNAMADPGFLKEVVKGHFTNVIPMIIIGGWINWAFSGFVTSKIPFPITLQFKEMLQREIELVSLDASWVSSASWYFLNVFGLRSIYNLVFNENEHNILQDLPEDVTYAGLSAPNEMKFAFKQAWEALEVIEHKWSLQGIEKEIIQ